MPQQPEGWERLACLCGTDRFAPMVNLRWKAGGGVTQEPAGYFCLECHGTVDSATLIARAHRKQKQQELRDLEAEIEETTPTPKVMAKKGA